MTEQEELVDTVKQNVASQKLQGRNFTRLRGDLTARIVKSFLEKHAPNFLTVVGPNVYVDGFSTEFDLAIVKSGCQPLSVDFTAQQISTASYKPRDILVLIEVKLSGTYGTKLGLQERLFRLRHDFEATHVSKWAYLTVSEVSVPVWQKSINYLDDTRTALGPDRVFCLRDSRKKLILPELERDWDRFVSYCFSI